MKKKIINKVIKSKINDWLLSIDDLDLRKSLKDKIIVTGGCIASMLLNENVNDYDVYLTDKEIVKRISKYYCNKHNEINKNKENKIGMSAKAWVLDGSDVELWKAGKKTLPEFAHNYVNDIPYIEPNILNGDTIQPSNMFVNTSEDRIKIIINSDGVSSTDEDDKNYDDILTELDEINAQINTKESNEKEKKYQVAFLSSNAITLKNNIQIVIRFYGDADAIHENYDFVHTKNYWTFEDGVILNPKSIEAILNKELIYAGSKYPLSSVIRTRKFIKRGWQINAGQYLKMCFQISDLNLNDISVLEDQLVGVDSAYFSMFINIIRNDIKKGKLNSKSFNVNDTYVVSVIDKVFGE